MEGLTLAVSSPSPWFQ